MPQKRMIQYRLPMLVCIAPKIAFLSSIAVCPLRSTEPSLNRPPKLDTLFHLVLFFSEYQPSKTMRVFKLASLKMTFFRLLSDMPKILYPLRRICPKIMLASSSSALTSGVLS